jgi:hypothetical protein
MKNQLDVTCYFISLIMRSTCFGHYYIHLQELATVLMKYHIGCLVLILLCVGDLVRLVLGGFRFADFSLQNEHHSKQDTPNLQHTTN